MVGLILQALRRRWLQAVLLFAIALVATTGAAAAPIYIVGSQRDLASAAVLDARSTERVVAAAGAHELGDDPAAGLRSFHDDVVSVLDLPGFTAVDGANERATFGGRAGQLAYRDNLCAHVVVNGSCPTAAGEVILDEVFAAQVGVGPGSQLAAVLGGAAGAGQPGSSPPNMVRVVGLYQPVDPHEVYWGQRDSLDGVSVERLGAGFAFTPLSTFTALGRDEVTMTVDLTATPQAFRDRDPRTHAESVRRGVEQLRARDIAVSSDLRTLADRIVDRKQLVSVGVAVGAGEFLLIHWFSLFLAVGQTSRTRRSDVRVLKMRGASRGEVWRLLAGQSLIPLAAGGAAGLAVAGLFAELTGAVTGGDARRAVWPVMAGSALVAIVGAMTAALVAERGMRSDPVAALERSATGPGRRWRTGVFGAVVLALAIGAVYQMTTSPARTGQGLPGELDLLAPILLSLAVGVLAARLLPVVALRVGRSALRARRLGTGLAAMHLARRPVTSRVLALVAVVVSMLLGTALSWSSSERAHHERAVFEVGDDRVLTVRAANADRLLTAVRQADPDGRYAMAAIQQSSTTPVLAVDTSRLAAVVPLLAAYEIGDWQPVAAALRPPTTPSITVPGGALALDATWTSPSTGPASLVMTLQRTDAPPVTVAFGPLVEGRHAYQATVDCPVGCRLVSLTLNSAPNGGGSAGAGTAATVHSLTGVDASVLADRTRWRADVRPSAQVVRITSSAGLTLTVEGDTPAAGPPVKASAFVLDSPTPVPVLGSRDQELGYLANPRLPLLDPLALPVQVVAEAHALPRIGHGVLVDLEYADRLAETHGGGRMQVWLAAGAPDSIVQRLVDEGLTVVTEDSVGDRLDELSTQGPPVVLRFLLFVALVGVILSMVIFSVMAAGERRPRGIELAALRLQGLRHSVVRRVAFGGYAAVACAAIATGTVTAGLLAALTPAALPEFDDGWSVLELPGPPGYVLPAAAVAVTLVLCALAAAAAHGLAAAVRREAPEA